MKDPLTAIRKAYGTALDNIVVGGQQIPFFALVPESGHPEYAYIETMSSEENSDKSEFGATVDIGLALITQYHGSAGRIEDTESLADATINKIKTNITSKLDLSADGFYMITNVLTGNRYEIENEKGEKAIKRVINFRHIVGQN